MLGWRGRPTRSASARQFRTLIQGMPGSIARYRLRSPCRAIVRPFEYARDHLLVARGHSQAESLALLCAECQF
jgi:hypothetical protein